MPTPRSGDEFPERTVYDPKGHVYYVPFVADDGRVGYRIGRTDALADKETFIYFNPSITDGGSSPDVFVYLGIENDPAEDEAQHFYAITDEAFGLSASAIQRAHEEETRRIWRKFGREPNF